MNNKEFAQFGMVVKSMYPNTTAFSNEFVAEAWFEALRDIDFHLAIKALQTHFTQSIYEPKVPDIRRIVLELRDGPTMSGDEAWGLVLEAIRQYGSYGAAEGAASLSEPIRSIVQNIGFRNLCLSENTVADRARFLDAYKQRVEREQKERLLPEGLKNESKRLTDNLANRLALNGKVDKK